MSGFAAGLAAEGHQVTLVALDDHDAVWHNSGEQFVRQTVSPDKAPYTLAALAAESDAVSVHNRVDLMALLLGYGPVGLFLHGPPSGTNGWPGKLPGVPGPFGLEWDATVNVVRAADRLAGPSLWAIEHTVSAFAATSPTDLVYPFVHPDFGRVQRRPGRAGPPLWVGRPVGRKGLGWLVEHRDFWSFPWLWAGDLRFADPDQAGVLAQVQPPVGRAASRPEMAALLAETSVVLAPYTKEAFGMVVPEAVAAGARVVGFCDGGLRESGSLTGVTLVGVGDREEFDAAVTEAIERGPLGERERLEAVAKFSLASSQQAYCAHVARLLG
jgi:glycosyltransferase involved in cell wall biosynthesis